MTNNFSLEQIPLGDMLRAKVQVEWLSALCCRFPRGVGRLIVGPNPVQWLLTKQHADTIDWRMCNGDPHASMLPARFTQGIVLQAGELRMVDSVHRRQHAAAFPVGKAVVAAVIPEGADQVIMGVGRGEKLHECCGPYFRGAIGTFNPETREFFQDNTFPGVEVGRITDLLQQFPNAQRV